ncbi:MAG: DUF4920 domain-containing protein [Tepidisphaeraceae bacterium]
MMNVSRLARVSLALAVTALFVGCAKDKATTAAAAPKAAETATASNNTQLPALIETCTDLNDDKIPTTQKVIGGLHVGPAFKTDAKDTVALETLLANPDAYNGKTVRVVGKVSQVCRKKGCWLTFGNKANADAIFVKFTDPAEGFLVPVEAMGHEVVAEGNFKVGKVSEEFAKHLAEEGGNPENADKIVGPQKMLLMMGAGVTIVDLK